MCSTGEEILAKSTQGATFLMMGQLFGKLVTFVLHNVLVRFLSPRIFGITSFLDFLSSTVLFFSREAIRLATLRIKTGGDGGRGGEMSAELQTAVNFANIPMCIGAPLAVVLAVWQYSNLNSYFTQLPFFSWSIYLVLLSILAELASEPLYVVNQFMLNYRKRSQFEGAAVAASCLVNFAVIYWYENWVNGRGETVHDSYKQEGIAVLAFALGKVARAMTLLALYYVDYVRHLAHEKLFSLSLTKVRVPGSVYTAYFDSDVLQHFKKVYFQLCFKHLLTEGDKLIINSLCTVEEQGIYSLLSNYGSLITRMVFAPIEESLLLFLTRLLSDKTQQNLHICMRVLVNLVKFYLYLALVIVIFGPTNSSFLLKFLIGSKWSSTSVLETIRVYCFYLPFLSMNGILEAFFASVASGDEILRHSYLMMLLSGVFLLNCWVFLAHFNLSLEGLIFSNIINMTLRIIYCSNYIRGFYKRLFADSKQTSLSSSFAGLKKILLLCIVVAYVDWSIIGYVQNIRQLLVNILLSVTLVLAMAYNERKLLLEFIKKSKPVPVKEN
ncbi:AFR015Wp [Eremothecium gossypii ATCC 10895]|uniref:Man(5)GlcNAc(2)-PP-dolichol translocation protein RFT1 n=1 Tax=Eremothecium gossypii (strain ATCC 10895 / CBS 109.51 / FGSC 9923 / NRRL Y-1056) TaxID=284811 RepID=RFT1_EREGS|nr:AFR015Wp [Eremothecium gossypii ATCC 10895]Q754Q7.1 RecName: Full=Oligosaccharide translocation protein RFT1 [Eremothecium gossypii ATCC 10895]AAS53386.1 AFR015Wp [Eremothecium gossypii ATCC 10895]AEY97697.1 FAFR015Wp [Eremothecium gossypii FDAG1]